MSRNTIKSQVTPASLFAKHADTIGLLATSVNGLKQATDTIASAKEVQAKCMESIKLCIKALRGDRVQLGDARTCPFTQALADTFAGFGLSKGTISNYLVDIKKAVNKGEPFVLNSARKAAEARKAEAEKAKAIEQGRTGPADIIPPASESRAGSKVKVHTEETIAAAQECCDPFTERDSSNGAPVQVQPNTRTHARISENIQITRKYLEALAVDLGAINMKLNQTKIEALRDVLNGIEAEVIEAMKR